MLNLPGGESDLSHRLPVIMITFDHIFLDFDHKSLSTLVSITAKQRKIRGKTLVHRSQCIFPSQFFTEHLQCPLIGISKQP